MTSRARCAVLAVGAIWLGACGYLAPRDERAAQEVHPLAFNHEVHTSVGLECSECHAGAQDGQAPVTTSISLPTLETCAQCHDESEPEPEVQAYLAGIRARPEGARWVTYSRSSDVIFSHDEHARVACARCHGDVAEAEATGPWVAPSMATCLSCHDGSSSSSSTSSTTYGPGEAHGGGLSCAGCHRELRRERPPASHAGDWEWTHGELARQDVLLPGDVMGGTCAYCHVEDTCVQCHLRVEPRGHTNFFRIRGHGLLAANDRNACATCHTQDMCIRCHQQTEPPSHRGGWGSPTNAHCTNCHLPVEATIGSCAVCHEGTPSHFTLAPPATPQHTMGLDCRQCHGRTARLPHPDPGADCTACHRIF